ncbi:CPBP family intramembrane glutamic endopeptidase [Carboxylicivirga linearis]|uniref:CPBP family intramembrane metalloprotease n=1 Tax=Carboxylicivirga linearis TaxID=1628157 RepID=A0ABS5JTG6_9BACT|nr:CPBP family intramembrane glutamic endopeptidase [Carboxylicivirga linearis]MBS2098152.1 CPBP family intramembrane metalloprotease [Carboxylicivirga linearis]
MTKGSLKYLPPLGKLFTVIVLVLSGSVLISLISILIAKPLFGIDIQSAEDVYHNIDFLRAIQILQGILVFIVPSALAVYLLYSSKDKVIPGKGHFTISFFLIAVVAIILSQSFISWSAYFNQQLQLPEAMSGLSDWIASKEKETLELTSLMINTSDWKQTLITVLLIAILPAIGEEWLFRGLIQRELMNIFKSGHWAVLVTAIIFSAIHIQFLTFLPRFILGIILGYMMLYSQNIWMPITAHFTNNFLAVVLYAFFQNKEMPQPQSQSPGTLSIIFSLVVIITLIITTQQLGKKQATSFR